MDTRKGQCKRQTNMQLVGLLLPCDPTTGPWPLANDETKRVSLDVSEDFKFFTRGGLDS